jgi:hypothetical protein
MIKGFDKAVTGLAQGESRKVRLEPEEAYGAVREDAVITLPPTTKMPEGLVEGDKVQLSNGMAARVTKIGEEGVTLDLNHELAGGLGAAGVAGAAWQQHRQGRQQQQQSQHSQVRMLCSYMLHDISTSSASLVWGPLLLSPGPCHPLMAWECGQLTPASSPCCCCSCCCSLCRQAPQL